MRRPPECPWGGHPPPDRSAPGYHARMPRPSPVDAPVPPASPLESALDRVGDRWSLLVVEALLDGERRFGELGSRVPGIAPNILTDRLRRLERAGVVVAEPYTTRPLRVRYRLTVDGQELAGVLRLLASWGAAGVAVASDGRGGSDSQPARHEPCGTPLEARWYCPTCARVTLDAEVSELRYL